MAIYVWIPCGCKAELSFNIIFWSISLKSPYHNNKKKHFKTHYAYADTEQDRFFCPTSKYGLPMQDLLA
jgi:hypothetical protein